MALLMQLHFLRKNWKHNFRTAPQTHAGSTKHIGELHAACGPLVVIYSMK
jgi:hypothetical protein